MKKSSLKIELTPEFENQKTSLDTKQLEPASLHLIA